MPLLQQVDGTWRNQGSVPLTIVAIRGGAHVEHVPPDAPVPSPATDARPLPAMATALLDLVPQGSAVASDGQHWFVALPRDTLAEVAP